jgi:hypothetical protein
MLLGKLIRNVLNLFKMKKIFLVSTGQLPERWSPTLKEIIYLNPDYIILLSNTEVNIEGNWGTFLNLLQLWLSKNNKIAHIVTPHLSGQWIRPNILAEQSYAMIESVVPLYKNSTYDPLVWDRVYCSYMFRPCESRGRLIDSIINSNILEHGYVTYHNTQVKTHDNFEYYEKSPIVFEEEEYSKDSVKHFIDPVFYRNSFIDIVTEASFLQGEYFLTEKTIRPIFHKKAFVTIGPQGFHKNYLCNHFGLKLYDEIVDYSFDDEPDLQKRIDGVIHNIKNLINNKNNFNEYYNTILPKLEYNKKVIEDIYNDPNKIVPTCLQPLLNPAFEFSMHGRYEVSMIHLINKYRENYGKLS